MRLSWPPVLMRAPPQQVLLLAATVLSSLPAAIRTVPLEAAFQGRPYTHRPIDIY